MGYHNCEYITNRCISGKCTNNEYIIDKYIAGKRINSEYIAGVIVTISILLVSAKLGML